MVYIGILEVRNIIVFEHEETTVCVLGAYKNITDAISAMPYDKRKDSNFYQVTGKLFEWEWESEPLDDFDFKKVTYRVVARNIQ